MTSTEKNRIYNITKNVVFSDNTSVKSRSSEIIINKDNIGFSIDVTGIELTEAEIMQKKLIEEIKNATDFQKVSIVLTSSKNLNDKEKKQPAKLYIAGVKKVLLVASGKGGVGKSTIATLMAYKLKSEGYKVGIVDADIYGPSIPSIFNVKAKPELKDNKMIPLHNHGITLNSIGFLIEPNASVSWRGPMVTKALYQLLSLTDWGELDYLIIDSPPGTGDIHLSLLQNYIIDEVIMVTTPQTISEVDVSRAISLYKKFDVHISGVIENMSYYLDQATHKEIKIFPGNAGVKISKTFGIPIIKNIPINSELSEACDLGQNLEKFVYLLI